MKHLGGDEAALLVGLAGQSAINLDSAQVEVLLEYLDRVIEMNQSINLTRITSPEAAVRLHLLDSLLPLPEVNASPAGRLLDIGTGGGFPGAALCIVTGRMGVLLDSVAKKSRSVNSILQSMELSSQVSAVAQRAEEHTVTHRAEYAVVTARAVAGLPALIELASPLLEMGGRLVALKGAPEESELLQGRAVASLVGMREVSVRRIEIAGGGERRCLVAYERTGPSQTRLPRRTGAAQNTPLA